MMLLLMFVCMSTASAQLAETFSDSNFTSHPSWTGDTAAWTIAPSLQLQSNSTMANSSFYLSTPSSKALQTQWNVRIDLQFNPSSLNYIDFYLTASSSNLSLSTTTGYFVRLGNTDDEISLYRKDSNGIVKLIDGLNGVLNSSSNIVALQVVRNQWQQWELYRTVNGGSTILEGTSFDSVYTHSQWTGILVKQSTASFFKKHFMDDCFITDFIPDTLPPVFQSVEVTGKQTIDLLFDEALETSSSELTSHYQVDHAVQEPASAKRDSVDPRRVHLQFASDLPVRVNLSITVKGLSDLKGNIMSTASNTFFVYQPLAYDVLIDEIMADPSPVVAMPDAEWVELRNTTGFPIALKNWRLAKRNDFSGPFPDIVLQPDSLLLVCSSSAVSELAVFGHAISVTNFPSLTNTGDLIYLLAADNKTIHAVEYSDSWYQNELKKNGGWSLEMIDLNSPCTGADNWCSSQSMLGASPGQPNSIDALNIDITLPQLLRAFAIDSMQIVLTFNEPLDSAGASQPSAYTISDGIGMPISAQPIAPLFNQVLLRLAQPLVVGTVYMVQVQGITDCIANPIGAYHTASVAIPEPMDSLDVVINEVLFNPTSDGVDFVELYNRSRKTFNLQEVWLANRNTLGTVDNMVALTVLPQLFFPGTYLVCTADATVLQRQYLCPQPALIVSLSNMPSYNDDAGSVVLLNQQGRTVDQLDYQDDWHFPLLNNREGVSLERIDPDGPTQSAQNWQSAASTVGFATPTDRNSQWMEPAAGNNEIQVNPKVFSPDQDGQDDLLTLRYQFDAPGYVATVQVFDVAGRPVRCLARAQLCGTSGVIHWNGLDASNRELPLGIYVVYTEVFTLTGKMRKYKQAVVLARKYQ